MKNKSRNQKGRRLQNHVQNELLKGFPHLKHDDVQAAIINEPGPDIKLSRIGMKLVPYQFECKNQEKMKTIYQWYKQAKKHGPLEPVLVCKQNSKEELAIISFKHFMELIK